MLITLDFETYFDRDYSLKRMTMQEYLQDERFEVICCAIKVDDRPTRLVRKPDLPHVFSKIPWENTAVLAHNTRFDGAIVKKYGCSPALYLDTLSMANALVKPRGSRVGLDALAPLVNKSKDSQALMNMQGVHYDDMLWDSAAMLRYVAYAKEDVETCHALFAKWRRRFPAKELRVIDIVLRMFIDGRIELDADLIAEALEEAKSETNRVLGAAGVTDRSVLRSRPKFAALLEGLGVEAPTKISDATGEETFAFAKNDPDFAELLDHDDPRVVALVEAKLNASSSIAETRAMRFRRLAATPGARLLVPLNYSGALTHRFSGADKLNLQNLQRGSKLRHAMKAPKGYVFVVVDASQIEARILAACAGCWVIVDAFAEGRDVYAEFASQVYGRPINKGDDPVERQVGKVGVLSLGYGAGAAKLRWMLLSQGVPDVTHELALEVVQTYRRSYREIPLFWREGDRVLEALAADAWRGVTFGPAEAQSEALRLPSGLHLHYPGIDIIPGDKGSQAVYRHPRYGDRHPIWGGHLCLAADTEVLTDRGWRRIVDVLPDDLLWDGEEWVSHDGLIHQGCKDTITLDGVRMTPEHEVLSADGWVWGALAGGLERPDVRLPDRRRGRGDGRQAAPVAVPMRLRAGGGPRSGGGPARCGAGGLPLVRVPGGGEGADARHDEPPCILGLAQHARPLPVADAPGLEELWRPWDRGVPGVGGLVRDVLGGHGADLSGGADPGPHRQLGGVFPQQLPVDHAAGAGQQLPPQSVDRHSVGAHDGAPGGAQGRAGILDAVLPAGSRSGRFGPVGAGRCDEPVYDLVNAGPRRRFVVRGTGGAMIVHNCENLIQALARIVITDAMVEIRGYDRDWHCALQVHDDVAYLCPEDEAEECYDAVMVAMTRPPRWAPSRLGLAAEGGIARRYGDAK